MLTITCCLAAVLSGDPPTAGEELLWDNCLDLWDNARALSPPAFPDIRQVDDFVVDEGGWLITGFYASVVVDAGWEDGGLTELYLRADEGGEPAPGVGNELVNVVLAHEKEFTGEQGFDRDIYLYWVEPEIALSAGTYWIGFRHPEATGQGTGYWLHRRPFNFVCNEREEEGIGVVRFSLDRGATWLLTGEHTNWEIRGERGASVPPVGFEVTRGELIAGDLDSLVESDDEYLIVEARKPNKVSQPSVQVIVDSIATRPDPVAVAVTVEASVLLGGAFQWIDLYDVDAAQWVRLDTREAATDDADATVLVAGDGARYVDPKTRRIRARISFYDLEVPVAGWVARIDRVLAEVIPE